MDILFNRLFHPFIFKKGGFLCLVLEVQEEDMVQEARIACRHQEDAQFHPLVLECITSIGLCRLWEEGIPLRPLPYLF